MRTLLNESVHNQLIQGLVTQLTSEGYYVQADHIGHPNGSPSTVNGYIPDIYAIKGTSRIIAEAETEDSISTDQTRQQWSAFSRTNASFHVIVPQRALSAAQNQANLWGINVAKWWYL